MHYTCIFACFNTWLHAMFLTDLCWPKHPGGWVDCYIQSAFCYIQKFSTLWNVFSQCRLNLLSTASVNCLCRLKILLSTKWNQNHRIFCQSNPPYNIELIGKPLNVKYTQRISFKITGMLYCWEKQYLRPILRPLPFCVFHMYWK